MKLIKVNIENFLSIKDITLEFDDNCKVLVGKNESGKSNILKALGYLDESQIPITTDIRQNLPTEQDIEKSVILFIFSPTEEELASLSLYLSANFKSQNPGENLLIMNDLAFSPEQIPIPRQQIIYKVDFKTLTKYLTIWGEDGSIASGWLKKLPTCPPSLLIESGGQQVDIGATAFVHESLGTIPENFFRTATYDDIISFIISSLSIPFSKSLPTILNWKYDEKLLLPSEINLLQFSNDPEMCAPLKNMFLLTSSEDIEQRISDATLRGKHYLKNLLNSVAVKTTEHLSSIWSDYASIQISLALNGENIEPIITEKNGYDISQRSEGFKRFICFLLQISVPMKSNQLPNTILLIDEPEHGLHPSSTNDLRDELLKISQSNIMVYSTHSIFMIDSKNIDRHLIVKKDNEITTILKAEDSEFAEEEMIFRALGHSVFNNLNERNLIFEGWKDKKLFQVYFSSLDQNYKDLLQNVGLCHATGVSSLKLMSPIFEVSKRKMLIISDGDNPAKQERKRFTELKMSGEWHTYQDLDSNITRITGEDFLTDDYFSKTLNSYFKKLKLPIINASDVPTSRKLEYVERLLQNAGLTKEESKEELTGFKNKLFDKLKIKDIDPSYGLVAEGIRMLLERQNP